MTLTGLFIEDEELFRKNMKIIVIVPKNLNFAA